ncbi:MULTISPECIES: malonyl-ACP O-methyltransferase BioC [unclassified Vibrio]|uniref:Malonyl-[acyl-carrier protein] O-methyltransferase n=1 Tax=Vibrio sp. HB236076 TaxID=3232307 RepID=A0AB39H874_9VIBR|nr:malonyl-ACP O-methyltransferase BioC [Vibrio sp. HB161653]MDP5253660.1 malonyl-ACP O-methyltransferase BioC [Vibrio sp. HB161653]
MKPSKTMNTEGRTDKRQQSIAHCFSRAAAHYDRHAHFQRQVGATVMTLLPQSLVGKHVVDIGSGTGYMAKQCMARGARVTCVDLSISMHQQAKLRCGERQVDYLVADAAFLPLVNQSADFVVSNLALQWCQPLSTSLAEIQRILKPNGQAHFSTLLAGSLSELRQAYCRAGLAPNINRFLSFNQVNIAMAQVATGQSRLRLENVQLDYERVVDLLRDLKGIGATYVEQRQHQNLNRKTLSGLERAFAQLCSSNSGLNVTYQVGIGSFYNE